MASGEQENKVFEFTGQIGNAKIRELTDKIADMIDDFNEEHNMTIATTVGILEEIKLRIQIKPFIKGA